MSYRFWSFRAGITAGHRFWECSQNTDMLSSWIEGHRFWVVLSFGAFARLLHVTAFILFGPSTHMGPTNFGPCSPYKLGGVHSGRPGGAWQSYEGRANSGTVWV